MSEPKKKNKVFKHRNRIKIDQRTFGKLMAMKRRLLKAERNGQSQTQA